VTLPGVPLAVGTQRRGVSPKLTQSYFVKIKIRKYLCCFIPLFTSGKLGYAANLCLAAVNVMTTGRYARNGTLPNKIAVMSYAAKRNDCWSGDRAV